MACPNGLDVPEELDALLTGLKVRIDMLGLMEDIDKAIECATAAFEASSETSVLDVTEYTEINDVGQAQRLSRLGVMYSVRYERTSHWKDIDQAVKLCNKAMASVPKNNPARHELSCNTASVLGQRFERTGWIDDAGQALALVGTVLETTTLDQSTRALALSVCAGLLEARYVRTGSLDDLNDAVRRIQDSLAATHGDLARPRRLNTLGNLLVMRYRRIGANEDLNLGIEHIKMALDITPPQQQPDRIMWSNNLAIALGQRYKYTNALEDLNIAIQSLSIAAIEEQPAASTLFSTRAIRLLERYGQTKEIQDLNDCINSFGSAINLSSPDDPGLPYWLNNLANALSTRFEREETIDDLNRAIEVLVTAVKQAPKDHPDRATVLGNLGIRLRERFYRLRKASDCKRSLAAFKKGWRCENAAPSFRVHLARDAATMLAWAEVWDEALEILEAAVQLLPVSSPRNLRNADKQNVLSKYAGLAALAASIALNAGKEPYHALELLELGRSIIATLAIGAYPDISDLRQSYSELAREYEDLRDELDSPADPESLLQPTQSRDTYGLRLQRRYEAEKAFNRLIVMIRGQAGFHDFLLPPKKTDMMAAANPDPMIVINVSALRCDAFIVENTQLRVVELPDLDLAKVREKATPQSLKSPYHRCSLLEWLWDAVMCPILEALDSRLSCFGNNLPHVW